MKVTVILNKHKKLANGEYPLMVRLIKGDKIKYKSLGYSLPLKAWNFKKHELRTNYDDYHEVQSLIGDKKQEYSDAILKLKHQRKNITLDSLVKLVENPVKDTTVLSYFETIIKRLKSDGSIGNSRAYTGASNSLKTYTRANDIMFSEIDYTFLNKYASWLKQKKVKPGAISVYMRTLRSLYNKAIKEGFAIKADYPFEDFKISQFKAKPRKRALSPDDIQCLKNLPLESDVLRYFMFSYYTAGMNFIDIAFLRWSDIGTNRIHYTRTKTGREMDIGLSDNIKKILSYYKPLTGIEKRNYVFPILNRHFHKTDTQKYDRVRKVITVVNRELKVIGTENNLSEPLTTYVARHTAITNMIRNGNALDVVQGIAGHTNINTTMVYLKEADVSQRDLAVNEL